MIEPRRRGRPQIDDGPSVKTTVRVPARDFDRACTQAQRRGEFLSDVIRRGLKRALRDTDEEDETE